MDCDGMFLAGQKSSLTLMHMHLMSKDPVSVLYLSSKGHKSVCLNC